MTEDQMRAILREMIPPFYQTADFWISLILGVVGLIYSFLAFKEASRAKEAAAAAGRSVKIQTITIELTEILQRLDKLDDEIIFSEARDLLNEVSRRLRRLVSPFADEGVLKTQYDLLKEALKLAKDALDGVKPTGAGVPDGDSSAVYYALQGHFASISECVAEISGTLEKRTLNSDENV